MIWWIVIVFIVSLILSVALQPKAQAPKSAALSDFSIPTADETRSIPVVFGEVDVTGPNVLWYGDLNIRDIRVKSEIAGYRYYLGFHIAVCFGPVDLISRITWADKVAWTGALTANGTDIIRKPGLFGGDKREGGVVGAFEIEMGDDGQVPNAYLESVSGVNPAYLGICSFIWKTGQVSGPTLPYGGTSTIKSGYIGTTAYMKPIAIRVRRILKGWQGDTWYPSKAVINTNLMNPAHIIYEVMSNTEWGMGVPTSSIDDAQFKQCADELYAEGFGLAMIWVTAVTVEEFIQQILNHAAMSLVLATKEDGFPQYQLVPIRGNYDIDDLDEYTPADILSLDSFERQGWGETVNEVTVTYTDPDTLKATPITMQDLGNIAAQGRRIAAKVELPGLRTALLAETACARELASRSTPVAKGKLTINTRAWNVPFGKVFKLTWPARRLDGLVCRVVGISKGTIKDNTISVDFLEDIYGLDLAKYIGSVPNDDPPDVPDTPADTTDASGVHTVISSTQTFPPVTEPADGAAYLVPVGATDVWTTHVGQIAIWSHDDQEYHYYTVAPGQIIYDQGGGTYTTIIGGTQTLPPISATTIAADHVTYDHTGSGLTATNAQAAIDEIYDQKGANSGLATLDSGGHVPLAQIPATVLGAVHYRGTWNANTNTPNIGASSPAQGDYYVVSTPGSTSLGGITDWVALDWAVYDGTTWEKVDNSEGTASPLTTKGDLYVFGSANDRLAVGTDGQFLVADSVQAKGVKWTDQPAYLSNLPRSVRGGTWTSSATIVAASTEDVFMYIHRACRIKKVIVLTQGGPGSCTIDVRKDIAANYPPNSSDSIVGATPPTITAGKTYEDSTLTGWTVDCAAGDVVSFHLGTNTSFTMVSVMLVLDEVEGAFRNAGTTWVDTVALTAGLEASVYIPRKGVIRSVALLGDTVNGSCQVDVWKKAIGSYPPTNAETITAGNEAKIIAARTYFDDVLTGWTTALAEGDVLTFHLDSTSTFTRIAIAISIEDTAS